MTRTSRSMAVVVLGLLLAMAGIHAQTSDRAGVLLQTAIQTEIVDGDLGKAIELYQEIVGQYGNERPVAAQALLHLGHSYEKLGDGQFRDAYDRVLLDYPEQAEPVAAARARLAALEVEATQPSAALHTELLWTTSDSGIPAQGGVSPDGRLMTYVDWNDRGNLAIRDFATGESRRLTHTADNGSGENGGLGYPFNRTDVSWGGGSPSCRHALSEVRGRAPGLVPNRCRLPGLPGVAAMARWLRLRGLWPRWRLAARGRALQVLRVRPPHVGDCGHDL